VQRTVGDSLYEVGKLRFRLALLVRRTVAERFQNAHHARDMFWSRSSTESGSRPSRSNSDWSMSVSRFHNTSNAMNLVKHRSDRPLLGTQSFTKLT
jgi:hypothetical protein